jgi:hypothetical protein
MTTARQMKYRKGCTDELTISVESTALEMSFSSRHSVPSNVIMAHSLREGVLRSNHITIGNRIAEKVARWVGQKHNMELPKAGSQSIDAHVVLRRSPLPDLTLLIPTGIGFHPPLIASLFDASSIASIR